ncbi:RagB/SusD family nutrient uptake outer membrane protein [Flammeovirga pacifica]|uniref:RagB/SusD family nutrient uptake outer membrane protein n=1 Tax=Flammeovirga pacifica TaxID=915059 RepID=A0A1S1YSE1_FLAPC|nr:RagB/SusD family nutrient uptake outer membrane protein [Flammeovirga pacifica]OHX63952.1 hypothetical protein NH26_20290 [Flammeovirga pacifica]
MKTSNAFIKYSLLVIINICLLGCSRDYLNEANPNEKPIEDYFNNLTESDKVLTASYATLMNHYVLNITEETWRSDMGYPGWNRPSPTNGDALIWYNHMYNDSSPSISKKWQALYEGVFRANQLIEGLTNQLKHLEEETLWIEQMAQARMLRGIYHFYLYQSFNNGRVVIRDKVPQTLEEIMISVSPAEEVLAFIKKDFEYAYANLPISFSTESTNIGRTNKGTAAMFLGNMYLFEGDYASAKPFYDELIHNAEYGYELVTDSDLQFTTQGEMNKESIFEICYHAELRADLGNWDERRPSNRLARSAPGNLGGSREFLPSAWIAYAYEHEVMDGQDDRNYYIDELGDTQLRNVPLRASAMIALVPDEQTTYYLSGNVPQQAGFGDNEYGYWKKFSNHDNLTHENTLPYGSLHSGKNVTVNRLAEAYLNLAECYIKEGNVEKGLEYMNAIRKRWGLRLLGDGNGDTSHDYDGVTYTADSLMYQLMYHDKPLELAVEGHMIRWIDLRRWGITKQNYQMRAEERYYLAGYRYVNLNGNYSWRGNSHLKPGDVPNGSNSIVVKDFEMAAVNFNPELHNYFPLPLSEIISNPNLDK